MVYIRYAEEANYNYLAGQGSGTIGHFTQIVWKNSTKVGVGIATFGAKTWVVAKYTPSGNYANQYTANVGYRKSGCKRVTFLKKLSIWTVNATSPAELPHFLIYD